MIIFACDPGGSTGWATFSKNEEVKFDGGQLETDDHHKELWDLLTELYHIYVEVNDDGPMHIVTESFEFRNDVDTEDRRKGLNLISREYIGVMKLFAQLYGVKIFQQLPVHAMKFVPDSRIEALGLIKKPKHPNRHYHDALRHLLLFVVYKLKIREGITNKWKKDRPS